VGLQGVVEEVRARLGLARETAAPHHEAPVRAPPPAAPQPTVVERTPRPAPAVIPEPARAAEAEPPAPKAATARRARAKPARAGKASSEASEAAALKKRKRPSRARAKAKKGGKAAAPSPQEAAVAVGRLVEALKSHPRQEELISAGRQKDQLVRSLIPLYLARAAETDVEVTSGTMSRFWGELGVTYAAPNAAKALRLHAGHAQDTRKGKVITPRGVQYVEEALERLRAQQPG
jgi:type IV secretory pathway VirB10-like protein